MTKNQKIIYVLVAIIVIFFAKKYMFPSDKDKIQGHINELAQLLTKKPKENVIALAGKVNKAVTFFSAPVEVKFTYDETFKREISDADLTQIKENISVMKFRYPWVTVSVEKSEISVDKKMAKSKSTTRLEFEDKDQGKVFDLYDVEMGWQKIKNKWRIRSILIEHVGE